jgi:DNA processing protein
MDLIYWLLLKYTPQVGDRTFYKALKYFTEPKNVFDANKKQLIESGIFKAKSIDFILNIDKNIANDDLEFAKCENCHIITIADKKYPKKLLEISDPPPILWVRGDVNLLDKQQLAIVGSRNPTTGGADNTREFAKNLSSKIIITSGMASGIDSNAHLGALEAENPTIAVCGTGLDRIYPASNSNLAKQIVELGALVSELPIGTRPLASNFPRRNRIITGMSDGVLVVEALIKSGSMISARTSLEQGREVFAIPGSIKNPLTEGPHSLIKDGAMLVDDYQDIIGGLNLQNDEENTTQPQSPQTKIDNILLKHLDYDGVSFDELVIKSGLEASIITGSLLELEMSGVVENVNNAYVLTKKI